MSNLYLIRFGFTLQGKRGIEKQPFQLPDFIAATGIEKIRQVKKFDSVNSLAEFANFFWLVNHQIKIVSREIVTESFEI